MMTHYDAILDPFMMTQDQEEEPETYTILKREDGRGLIYVKENSETCQDLFWCFRLSFRMH